MRRNALLQAALLTTAAFSLTPARAGSICDWILGRSDESVRERFASPDPAGEIYFKHLALRNPKWSNWIEGNRAALLNWWRVHGGGRSVGSAVSEPRFDLVVSEQTGEELLLLTFRFDHVILHPELGNPHHPELGVGWAKLADSEVQDRWGSRFDSTAGFHYRVVSERGTLPAVEIFELSPITKDRLQSGAGSELHRTREYITGLSERIPSRREPLLRHREALVDWLDQGGLTHAKRMNRGEFELKTIISGRTGRALTLFHVGHEYFILDPALQKRLGDRQGPGWARFESPEVTKNWGSHFDAADGTHYVSNPEEEALLSVVETRLNPIAEETLVDWAGPRNIRLRAYVRSLAGNRPESKVLFERHEDALVDWLAREGGESLLSLQKGDFKFTTTTSVRTGKEFTLLQVRRKRILLDSNLIREERRGWDDFESPDVRKTWGPDFR